MNGKLYAAVIYIFGVCVAVQSTDLEEAVGMTHAQEDFDDGGQDDAARVNYFIEKKPLLKIQHVEKLEEMGVPIEWHHDTIAPKWIIKRMGQLQSAVVKLRKSFESVMRVNAAWSCRWHEVHLPEFFACVTKTYVDLVGDDSKDYPKGLLLTIKEFKEMYMKSYARKIPVYKLNNELWGKTAYTINGLIPIIYEHRRKLQELVIDRIKGQMTSVEVICRLPTGDRHPVQQGNETDPAYVFEEDYSPMSYNRI